MTARRMAALPDGEYEYGVHCREHDWNTDCDTDPACVPVAEVKPQRMAANAGAGPHGVEHDRDDECDFAPVCVPVAGVKTQRMAANTKCVAEYGAVCIHSVEHDYASECDREAVPCVPVDQPAPVTDPVRATQVGGEHYLTESGIQPWDVIAAWGLDYWEGNVIKYLMRHRNKNGVEDLKKARHFLDYLIQRETEYGN